MTEIPEPILLFRPQEPQVFFLKRGVGLVQGNQIETLYVSEPAERPLVRQIEITPHERCARQVCVFKRRVCEVAVVQYRVTEFRAVEPCAGQAGPSEICAFKIRSLHVKLAQIRKPQDDAAKILMEHVGARRDEDEFACQIFYFKQTSPPGGLNL